MPEMVKKCIHSWKEMMPNYSFHLWNEDNFDINCVRYVREAYEQGKFAFVSDYVRLYALWTEGGIYLDTDVCVLKSFDPLLGHTAFAGYEGSKKTPIGTCVLASEPHGEWVGKNLELYHYRCFKLPDGTCDLTTNVVFITRRMMEEGFVCDGVEKEFAGLHIFPLCYFSPRRTTGEFIVTSDTYADHLGLCSWGNKTTNGPLSKIYGTTIGIFLIKVKRMIFG